MRHYISKLSLLDSALLILLFFLYYYGLGSYGLLNNNEGLYAEIPREMLESGQYIIPYLNGVPYIEKPPLLYWLIALVYKIGGVSETTARLIPATAGVALSLATYFFARAMGSLVTARLSLLVLLTMGGLIVFSRMVFFDVLLTLFLSASLFSFFMWYKTHHKVSLRFFYLFLALAVMTKGIVALGLIGLGILLFLILTGSLQERLRTFLDCWGILLFLAVVLPWHIAASFQEKEFIHFYFINEHFLRFLGRRIPKDYYHGPWYYYFPRLFLTALPWSFTLPLIFKKSSHDKSLMIFLWVWVLVFFVFFSVSQAKANYYLVTIFPPLSLLFALKLEAFSEVESLKKIRQAVALFLAIFLPAAGLISFYRVSFLPSKFQPFVAGMPDVFFWIWLGCSVMMTYSLKFFKHLRFWPESLTAFQMVPFLLISLVMAQQVEPLFSARKIMQQLSPENLPLVLYRDFEKMSSVRFYAKQNVPIVESLSNDLYFGLRTQQGASLNLSSEQFQQPLSHQGAYVIVFHEQKHNFEKNYPAAHLIHQKEPIYLYKCPKLALKTE
jgi:4-amino-4-deoxy-L-arabinose transferase-like glycosyltransferase